MLNKKYRVPNSDSPHKNLKPNKTIKIHKPGYLTKQELIAKRNYLEEWKLRIKDNDDIE